GEYRLVEGAGRNATRVCRRVRGAQNARGQSHVGANHLAERVDAGIGIPGDGDGRGRRRRQGRQLARSGQPRERAPNVLAQGMTIDARAFLRHDHVTHPWDSHRLPPPLRPAPGASALLWIRATRMPRPPRRGCGHVGRASVTGSTLPAKTVRPPQCERAAGASAPTAPRQAPRAGLEPATNRLHRVPPFPTGVDYLITMDLAACRWRALEGRLFFRHSLVSAPSSRP